MRFSQQECAEKIQQEAINRAATYCEFEATLKRYEAALLLGHDKADELRAVAHDFLDAIMDSQVRCVNVVKNTNFK